MPLNHRLVVASALLVWLPSATSAEDVLKPSARGAPYTFAQFAQRELHALDYCQPAERVAIETYSGQVDARSCLQDALNDAAMRGKDLIIDAGYWNLKGSVRSVGAGQKITGEGWSELLIIDRSGATIKNTHGTVINFDYPATADPLGLVVDGTATTIRDIEFRQTQPDPGKGWKPTIGPWAISAQTTPYAATGGHRLTVEHVMLRNVYDGIDLGLTRGGYVRDVYGQPMHTGIRVISNVDEPHFDHIHFGWTYWSGQPDVQAFSHANLVGLDFQRIDNPMLSNILIYNAKVGLKCSQRTDKYNGGNCSKLSGTNLDFDNVNVGVLAEDGADMSLVNLYVATPNEPGSACIRNVREMANDYYQPPRINVSNGDCDGQAGSAVEFGFAPGLTRPTVHMLSNFRVRRFGLGGAPNTPAISAIRGVTVAKSNLIVEGVAEPARIFGGGGKLQ